jgi:RNA polymerase sigma-70 factor (ECF subfamily)
VKPRIEIRLEKAAVFARCRLLPLYHDTSMSEWLVNPEQVIHEIKSGNGEALGPLLERYRNYLRLLARIEIGRRLQGKLDASDLVQETFLEAHRHFPSFEGIAEAQLLSWLRQILAGRVASTVRRYLGTQGRNVSLEQELNGSLDNSARWLEHDLAASATSPSGQAVRREQAVLLADALDRLPADYREAIILRHLEGLTFPEVARRMNRSQDSVEKLWLRALTRLRRAFGGPP